MKKLCNTCGIEKLKSEFGKDKNKWDGLKYLCKECHNKANLIYRQSHPEKYRSVNLAYARSDHGKAKQRANKLRRNFWPHLTNEEAVKEYDRLFHVQKNSCAICDIHQSALKIALCVDHDHKTGKVRGLLCHKCNYYLVKAHNIETIIKLADYLKKHS